jgi:beta-lactamase class A
MTKPLHYLVAALFAVFVILPAKSQDDSLRERIKGAISGYPGEVGVAMYNLSTGDSLSIHGKNRYPMQSVFKFPIALAVLDGIDKEVFSLQQKIFVKKEEMISDTWSPLAKKYPDGNIDVTVEDLLTFMVRDSDNNACDILLRLIGGPKVVDGYIRRIGITNMEIRHNEHDMGRTWEAQFDNWCDPWAMAKLFRKFYDKELLSVKSQELLWTLMVATTTGPRRLKGELPGIEIAHRTGTSGINKGQMAAVNDVGIIRISEYSYVVLVVFITGAPEPMSTAEQIIARVAKVVYEHFKK